MEEQQRTLLVPLKEDFIQFDVKEPEKPAKEEPKKQRSELHYLMINAHSVITNGINHSHFKYMKASLSLVSIFTIPCTLHCNRGYTPFLTLRIGFVLFVLFCPIL